MYKQTQKPKVCNAKIQRAYVYAKTYEYFEIQTNCKIEQHDFFFTCNLLSEFRQNLRDIAIIRYSYNRDNRRKCTLW